MPEVLLIRTQLDFASSWALSSDLFHVSPIFLESETPQGTFSLNLNHVPSQDWNQDVMSNYKSLFQDSAHMMALSIPVINTGHVVKPKG